MRGSGAFAMRPGNGLKIKGVEQITMTRQKGFFAAILLIVLLAGSLPARSQDLVPVSDITGGSSVFVFRNSQRSATKKFVVREKQRRSKAKRLETAKKINTQYVKLAKVAPRRTRTKAVDPNNLPDAIRIKSMPKGEAAKLFAGVGEYYIDHDDTPNAVDFFREATVLDPKYAVARNGLSEALARRGNELLVKDEIKGAQKYFDEALTINPNNAVAFYGLGELYADQNDDKQAIANYEKALHFDKELTEIYIPLGILYFEQGEIAKADGLLSKALVTSADNAEMQYFIGLIRYGQNNNADALKAFANAKRLDPNYAEAFYYNGNTLGRMGRSDDAIKEYQEAVRLKPAYFDALFALATAYFEAENYDAAITEYEKALRLRNNSIDAYANLGDAYRLSTRQNKFNDAEAKYNLAISFIERDPTFSKTEAADIYSKIGYVVAKQCEINMAKAVKCGWTRATSSLEKAVGLSQSPVDYANLGWAYYNAAKSDQYDKRQAEARVKLVKAKDNLQRAVESNPHFLEGPLLNLGMAYSDLGDYSGAIDAFTKVIKREPKWVFAINELGMAYLGNKNYKEAAAQFRKAIDRDDKYAAAYYNLARAEIRQGNMGEAKKAHARLKQLKRNDLAGRLELETAGGILR